MPKALLISFVDAISPWREPRYRRTRKAYSECRVSCTWFNYSMWSAGAGLTTITRRRRG